MGIFLLKSGDDVHGFIAAVSDVLTPVHHIQCDFVLPGGENQPAGAKEDGSSAQACAYPAEDPTGLGDLSLCGLFPLRTDLQQIHTHHQHENQQKQQGKHCVDPGLHRLFGVGIDLNGQGEKTGAGDKIADHEIVKAHGKGHNSAGDNAGHDLMEGDLKEGLKRRAA